MKKQLFKSVAFKAYSTALLTSALLFTGFNPAKATEGADSARKMQITYIGSANNLMTFNINYENASADKFVLELADANGETLYQKKFTDKTFKKNIYLKNIGEQSKVKFTIRAGKNVFNQTFDIDSKTTVIQDMVVTKL